MFDMISFAMSIAASKCCCCCDVETFPLLSADGCLMFTFLSLSLSNCSQIY